MFDTRQSCLCRVSSCTECSALGKGRFAECLTLPSAALGKAFFAECPTKGTRQRIHLCRVPPRTLGKEPAREGPHVRLFAECSVRHSAKPTFLPSAGDITLGKEPKPVPRSVLFAECYDPDTRQSASLPSVTLGKVTSIYLFYLFFVFHPHKQKISHIYITYIHHRYHHKHK